MEKLIYQTLVSMHDLLEKRLPEPSSVASPLSTHEYMTVREAQLELNVSRSTIDRLRRNDILTSYYHNKCVRLSRDQVLAAKSWYSIPKGKI